MRSVQISQEEMEEQRVARFEELVTWDVQRNPDVPLDVLDLLYARELCMAVAPAGLTGPFANTAPIKDADFSMTWAKCPPRQGPGLHSHDQTTETFTCIRGRFRIYWGDDGEHEVVPRRARYVLGPAGCHSWVPERGRDGRNPAGADHRRRQRHGTTSRWCLSIGSASARSVRPRSRGSRARGFASTRAWSKGPIPGPSSGSETPAPAGRSLVLAAKPGLP